jgi:hypothetical protein
MVKTPLKQHIMRFRLLFLFALIGCIKISNAQSLSTTRPAFYSRYQSVHFIPIQLIGNVRDEVDATVGLRYERSLKDNEISISVPLTRSMINGMTYFSPGLKIFLRNKKNVRFYTTPQLYTALGYGEWPTYRWIDGIQVTQYKDALRYKIGFIMSAGADFIIGKRWQLGLDYGWGLTYFDKYRTLRNPYDDPRKVTTVFQLSCGLGYKF